MFLDAGQSGYYTDARIFSDGENSAESDRCRSRRDENSRIIHAYDQ
jgi:hypothetical protein